MCCSVAMPVCRRPVTCWHLHNAHSSLLLGSRDGTLCWEYIGSRLDDGLTPESLLALTEAVVPHGELDRPARAWAFPTQDGAPQPMPALAVRHTTGVPVDLKLVAVHEADGTEFRLEDTRAGIAVTLSVRSMPGGVWQIQPRLSNTGERDLVVDWLASAHVPLPSTMTTVFHSDGFWANELLPSRAPLGSARQVWESDRGRSSHASTASLMFGDETLSETQGDALQVALQWPGNHRLQVAPQASGGHAVQLGVNACAGELLLPAGQQWQSPPVLLAFSDAGRNGLRQQMADYWRGQSVAVKRRPVHFNSWEGCYFDHDMPRMLALIEQAAALGAERFVLDDGWMAGRTEPGVGLGDWRPCPVRYPEGLGPIAAAARAAGMAFGLWLEPEMVTLDSELARAHPSWVIGHDSEAPISGRQQYLLDLTNPNVQQHLDAMLDRVVGDARPDYIKWDMNRDFAQVPVGMAQGPLAMTRAWLELLRGFRARHPNIVVEVCAAGGARNNVAALLHADRLWPTDSLDPIQRLGVLKQTSLLLPPERLGWHVGTGVTETSGVATPLTTRCALSMLGHMGLELHPDKLSSDERITLQQWIARFKSHRDWLATAQLHFLASAPEGAEGVLALSADGAQGLLIFVQCGYPTSGTPPMRRLPALSPAAHYALALWNSEDCGFAQDLPQWLQEGELAASGDALMQVGLRQPPLRNGYCAVMALTRC